MDDTCPVCGALPGEVCRTPLGYPMPLVHTRRQGLDPAPPQGPPATSEGT